ncbi:alpha/beta fold hydrolase [Xylophilus sp. Kf1]|nr:alpha/beta fold hydrolase [Xylophilus sp. Kf1]
MLHALGSSARAWSGVVASLGAGFEAIPVDLPGFGEQRDSHHLLVVDMADHVAAIVRERGAARWLLVGHSMGGKIASIVASRALAGEPGLYGLAGVVLLAGSPPSPEPMDEERRQKMSGWAVDGPLDAAAAKAFVDANSGGSLDPMAEDLALQDLRQASPQAWLRWLERGSREDWTGEVGTLDLPALIVVGGEDGDLGETGQRETNARVYPRAKLVVEPGAGHLLPLERPAEVAAHIRSFWHDHAGAGPAVPVEFARLIGSSRVSRRVRAALVARALADDPGYVPAALTPAQLDTLRAVADRVVPQSGPKIDLAARLDAQLAAGKGDGWRFADMPPDGEACAAALDGLAGFDGWTPEEQHARLTALEQGEGMVAGLSGAQMKRWFEDLRSDLVRIWTAHPATMARIGFDGFANGGDGVRKQGFERLGADQREAWEPMVMEVVR